MTTDKTIDLPDGMGTVTPHLVCDGGKEAIAFYEKAFGATRLMSPVEGPDGKIMHAGLTINGSSVYLNDEFCEMGAVGPKKIGGTPVTIHLTVGDADAWARRAIEAGATEIMPVADQFWGDRYGMIEDPFGHRWSLATPGEKQLSQEEIMANMEKAMGQNCAPGEES
ncbi:VOC family protein [Aquisalinus flavus]|uniref:Glyoxalase n=1 Tax=Aquisalinus flavus TaxID=1526572 RepID=A0A8J2V306_9PROT|nr:VOC family protein [Aquisalinus flavus]MBD0425327.1 VOC family protein [Aquisalinus flavus]UNE49021.1 VOC family protein [Aquisalinus flavus]GGD16971.1 glyoxalase [Aquisalinus flavus]